MKTPILALLATFAAFFVSWICGAGGFIARQRQSIDGPVGLPSQHMGWYEYLYPNAYDTMLLSSETGACPGSRLGRWRASSPSSRSRARCSSAGGTYDGRATAAVRLVALTKRFGAKVAVDAVSLSIESGTAFGLIGPNGAGKTTTFSMMAGYLRPTRGTLEVLGFAPTAVDSLRSRVGVLPQDALLPANDRVGDFLVHLALLQNIPKSKATDVGRSGARGGPGERLVEATLRLALARHGEARVAGASVPRRA